MPKKQNNIGEPQEAPQNNVPNAAPQGNAPQEAPQEMNDEQLIKHFYPDYVQQFIFTREDKLRYIGYLKPFYRAGGIELTEKKIEEIVNQKANKNLPLISKIKEQLIGKYRALSKYSIGKREKYFNDIERVFGGLLLPETTEENRAYNKSLNDKMNTREGQKEIILESAKLIKENDPVKLISTDTTKCLENYIENFRAFQIMFISDNNLNAVTDLVNKKELSPDDPLVKAVTDKRLPATHAGYIKNYFNMMIHPISALIPDDFKMTGDLLGKGTSPDFWGKDVPEAFVHTMYPFLISLHYYVGDRQSAIEDFINKPIKKEVNEQIRLQNITFNSLAEKDQIILDESNNPVDKNSFPECGKNYLVLNKDGRVRGFRMKPDPNAVGDVEVFNAKLPDDLFNDMSQAYERNMQYLIEGAHFSEKLTGIFGPKVFMDYAFEKVGSQIKNSDYDLPETISPELAECLTLGTFLNPAHVNATKNGSTMANIGEEQKAGYLIFDWVCGNDTRAIGAEEELIKARSEMPVIFNDLKNGNPKKAKEAFERAAKMFAANTLDIDEPEPTKDANLFDNAICTKLAKVISENPFGIADGIDEFTKSSIQAKAHFGFFLQQGAKAAADLMSKPGMSEAQKRECLTRVAVAGMMRTARDKSFLQPDVSDVENQILEAVGEETFDYGEDFRIINKSLLNKQMRLYFPSKFECALAQKPEELYEAVKGCISPEEIDKLMNTPPELLSDGLSKLSKLPVDNVMQNLPVVKELVPANAEKIVNDLKEKFREDSIKDMTSKVSRNRDLVLDLARTNSAADAPRAINLLISEMKTALNRTEGGVFGPSKEFTAVSEALAELSAVPVSEYTVGSVNALAWRLVQTGQKYLEAKANAGINARTEGYRGARFQNVSDVISRATELTRISGHACKDMATNTSYAEKDILTPESFDCIAKLEAAQEVLEDADPFYYHSSPQFREIKRRLDRCIDMMNEFSYNGITPEERAEFDVECKALNTAAQYYILDKANPNTGLGTARLHAVGKVFKAASAAYKAVTANDRTAVRERAAQEELERRQKKAHADEEGIKNSEYFEKSDYYRDLSLTSKKYDPDGKVTALARKVRLSNKLVTGIVRKGLTTGQNETKLLKSLLADRLIADMIVKERAEHKDAAFEKAYIENPAKIKKALLAEPQNSRLMEQFLRHPDEENHCSIRLDLFNKLQNAAGPNLECGRKFLLENAPKATEPQNAMEDEKVADIENAAVVQ